MASCSKDASNITVRKKPVVPTTESSPDTQTKPSINQLSSTQDSHVLTDYDTSYDSDTSPNVHSKSVDGTTTNISSLSEMQDTIVQLTAKLETTEHELENSILENNDLNKQLTKLTTEIKILKSLCHSSTMIESSPINNDKKKKHSRFSQNVSSTPSSTRVRDYASHASHQCLQQKIINLEKNLQNAKDEIKRLTTQIQLLEHSLCSKPKPEWTLKPLNLSTKDITSHLQHRIPEKTIAIFGAQQCVGLAAALQDSRKSTQYEKYGIFAHTMPNANSDTIVKCCTKANLKPEDKIIICLGENDRIVGSVLTQLKNRYGARTLPALNIVSFQFRDRELSHRPAPRALGATARALAQRTGPCRVPALYATVHLYIIIFVCSSCGLYHIKYKNSNKLLMRLSNRNVGTV
ncbi:hypothetical protein SFRURICE_020013 [Spodoptera frugiperda]|nr:hypothetical protein SFRURICE_020013 [Spodoptera frugiperda]